MYIPIALFFGASLATASNVPESSKPISETHLPIKLNSHVRTNVANAQVHKTVLPVGQSAAASPIASSVPSISKISSSIIGLSQTDAHPSPISPQYNDDQFKQAYVLNTPSKSTTGLSALISNAFTGFTNKFGRRSGKISPLDSTLYNLNSISESAGNALDLNNIQALNDMIGSALNTYATGSLPGAQATITPAQVGLMNTISSFVSNNLNKGKKIFDLPKSFYKSIGERIIGSGDHTAQATSAVIASVPLKDSIVSTIKLALSYLKPARSSSSSVTGTVDSGNLKRRTSDPYYAQNQQWAQGFYTQHPQVTVAAQQAQFGGNFPVTVAEQQPQIQQVAQQQISESQRQAQFVAQHDGSFSQYGYGNANELALNLAQNQAYNQAIQHYPHYIQQPPVHKSSFYKKSKNWISGKFSRKNKYPQNHQTMIEHGQFGQQTQQYFPQPQSGQQSSGSISQQQSQQTVQQHAVQQQAVQQKTVQQQTVQQKSTIQHVQSSKSQLPSQTMTKVHNKLGSLPGLFNQKTQVQAQNEQQFIPLQPQQQPIVDVQPSSEQFSSWNSESSGPQSSVSGGGYTSFFTQQPSSSLFTGFQNYPPDHQQSMYNGPQVAGTVASSTVSPFGTSPTMNINVDHHSALNEHALTEDNHSDSGVHDQGLYFFDQAHPQTASESVTHEEAVKPNSIAPSSAANSANTQTSSSSSHSQSESSSLA